MSLHRIEFEYIIPESGIMEIELDETLSLADRVEIARQEIQTIYPEVEDITIEHIKEI